MNNYCVIPLFDDSVFFLIETLVLAIISPFVIFYTLKYVTLYSIKFFIWCRNKIKQSQQSNKS